MSFYKEGYYFVPWREVANTVVEEGDEPTHIEQDVPENVYCETLGRLGYRGPGEGPHDDICLVRWPEGTPEPPGLRPVSTELKGLLRAGQVYKPALAIANEMGRWVATGDPKKTEAEAVEKFSCTLQNELDHQRDRPFFLAKALQPCYIGYRYPGDYVWIVGYRPERVGRQVSWVSRDFFVYQDPITDFEVDAAYLAERFAVRPHLGG